MLNFRARYLAQPGHTSPQFGSRFLSRDRGQCGSQERGDCTVHGRCDASQEAAHVPRRVSWKTGPRTLFGEIGHYSRSLRDARQHSSPHGHSASRGRTGPENTRIAISPPAQCCWRSEKQRGFRAPCSRFGLVPPRFLAPRQDQRP